MRFNQGDRVKPTAEALRLHVWTATRLERIWFSPACVKEGPLFRDIARCEREQAEAAEELRAGHPDRRGLEQCIDDWIMEEALIEAEREDA
jgi:hypothetical protein